MSTECRQSMLVGLSMMARCDTRIYVLYYLSTGIKAQARSHLQRLIRNCASVAMIHANSIIYRDPLSPDKSNAVLV